MHLPMQATQPAETCMRACPGLCGVACSCVRSMVVWCSRFGVGGEYPMAAGSAAERAEAGGKAMAKHRGREV